MADRAVVGRMVGFERKRDDFVLALLHRQTLEVDRAAVDARRRAGLEALKPQSQTAQRLGERLRRRHTVRAGLARILADNDAAAEEGARGDDNRLDRVAHADSGHDRRNRAVLLLDGNDLVLHEEQVFLPLERVLHIRSVFNSVGLRAQRMHGGTLSAVEHTVLNAGRIGRPRHLSTQCIDLSNEVSLGGAADGRIARHIAHSVQIDGKTRGFRTQTGTCERGLDARVTGSDHRYIKRFCVKNRHRAAPPFFSRNSKMFIGPSLCITVDNSVETLDNSQFIDQK